MSINLAEKIQNKIDRLPEPLIQEVLKFINFLEFRHGFMEPNINKKEQQNCNQIAIQTIAAFRGSGKGGGTKRLLADRQIDLDLEA
ncbi:MAG: DUF2281 domain-containing protein [Magnetococcus sp. DMHC-6]